MFCIALKEIVMSCI